MLNKFSKEYEINYYDVDYKLKCKLSSIVNFLCDVGNYHAESLGETIESLVENNCAWVFYKYDIKIKEYPKYRDTITVETEPIGFKKFYAYRSYYIKNSEGKLLGEAIALFFLINIEKRRPMRVLPEQYVRYGADGDLKKNIEMENILKLEKEDHYKDFNIRYSDIDSNGHVNNVKYIEWAIESVPVEVIKDYELKRIKVVFEKETTYGDTVHVSAQVIRNEENELVTIHTIKSEAGVELTKLEGKWVKEKE
ncbi:acyl-[acyl-carrier-protein] thioesterase [Clostridium paraputrificum]|uniref:acyl-[acyl-carrier-protein] thioesterase n=1 Tax=Clostridium TaxID=1485 RepID=UPI003D3503B9